MIDVRIICAHDAVKPANSIKRLLAAEGHAVDVFAGRHSMACLEESKLRREAVLLIWSLDAPSTDYMRKWAVETEPSKLAEIARAAKWPPLESRVSNVIDFSQWGGERGGSAWRALEDRLRQITRATEPKKPTPLRPVLALGGAALAAAGGALMVRIDEHPAPGGGESFAETQTVDSYAGDGLGGPLAVLEPASGDFDDLVHVRSTGRSARMLAPLDRGPLESIDIADPLQLRDPTLLSRLGSLTDRIGERLSRDQDD